MDASQNNLQELGEGCGDVIARMPGLNWVDLAGNPCMTKIRAWEMLVSKFPISVKSLNRRPVDPRTKAMLTKIADVKAKVREHLMQIK